MKERPILMSAPMVRAILDGRKSQTRRAMKPQPEPAVGWDWSWPLRGANVTPGTRVYWRDGTAPGTATTHFYCPYGAPGDRLWVRETWWCYDDLAFDTQERDGIVYRADLSPEDAREERALARRSRNKADHWRPSIYMPRWASRITLEVTGVRVERLQDISTADAWAEGIPSSPDVDPVHEYAELWETINGDGSWTANPWVWVVAFAPIADGARGG